MAMPGLRSLVVSNLSIVCLCDLTAKRLGRGLVDNLAGVKQLYHTYHMTPWLWCSFYRPCQADVESKENA